MLTHLRRILRLYRQLTEPVPDTLYFAGGPGKVIAIEAGSELEARLQLPPGGGLLWVRVSEGEARQIAQMSGTVH